MSVLSPFEKIASNGFSLTNSFFFKKLQPFFSFTIGGFVLDMYHGRKKVGLSSILLRIIFLDYICSVYFEREREP